MKKSFLHLIVASVLFGGLGVLAQGAADVHESTAHAKAKADVTYGRIKELTPGQKVTVDVDNAPDKSFDLTDKDKAFVLAKGLAVGDAVKIVERKVNGKDTVRIVRDTRTDVKHGDKTRAEEKRDAVNK
jgi:hypothetical protein